MLLKQPIPRPWHGTVRLKYLTESGTIQAVKPDFVYIVSGDLRQSKEGISKGERLMLYKRKVSRPSDTYTGSVGS
jgi:hypothetical protein